MLLNTPKKMKKNSFPIKKKKNFESQCTICCLVKYINRWDKVTWLEPKRVPKNVHNQEIVPKQVSRFYRLESFLMLQLWMTQEVKVTAILLIRNFMERREVLTISSTSVIMNNTPTYCWQLWFWLWLEILRCKPLEMRSI